jgi:hypothetical protein
MYKQRKQSFLTLRQKEWKYTNFCWNRQCKSSLHRFYALIFFVVKALRQWRQILEAMKCLTHRFITLSLHRLCCPALVAPSFCPPSLPSSVPPPSCPSLMHIPFLFLYLYKPFKSDLEAIQSYSLVPLFPHHVARDYVKLRWAPDKRTEGSTLLSGYPFPRDPPPFPQNIHCLPLKPKYMMQLTRCGKLITAFC